MDRNHTSTKINDEADGENISRKREASAMEKMNSDLQKDDIDQKGSINSWPKEMLFEVLSRSNLKTIREISRTFKSGRELIKDGRNSFRHFFEVDYIKIDAREYSRSEVLYACTLEFFSGEQRTVYNMLIDKDFTCIKLIDQDKVVQSLRDTSFEYMKPNVLAMRIHNSEYLKFLTVLPNTWKTHIEEVVLLREPECDIFERKPIEMFRAVLPGLAKISFDYFNIAKGQQRIVREHRGIGTSWSTWSNKGIVGYYSRGLYSIKSTLTKIRCTSNVSEYGLKSGQTCEMNITESPIREVLLRQRDTYSPFDIIRVLMDSRFDSPRVELFFDRAHSRQELMELLQDERGGQPRFHSMTEHQLVFTLGRRVDGLPTIRFRRPQPEPHSTVFVLHIDRFVDYEC